jgi:hypothetical protein
MSFSINALNKTSQTSISAGTNDIELLEDTDPLVFEAKNKASQLAGDIKPNQTSGITTTSKTDADNAKVFSEMEQNFITSFSRGDLDEYDPRAVMIAAKYTKMQFNTKDERNKGLNNVLLDLGINKIDDDVASDIALQAIELANGFETDVDTSKNLQNDLFGILVQGNRKFKSQNDQSKIDTSSLKNVVNMSDLDNSQKITRIFTLSSYQTNVYSSYTQGDQLTVSEMLADFSGQASEHDAGAYNKGSTIVNAVGVFSDSSWHDADQTNNRELLELKKLMPKELLDLTFDNGEGYVFGKTLDAKIILLAKVDNDQLGKQGFNHLTNAASNTDTAFNSNFQLLDDSKLKASTKTCWGAEEEFSGQSSMKINGREYKDVNTISATRHTTPLILDLDGDGLDLTSHTKGINFDLTGDGVRDQTAWTKAQNSFDDAFLVLDANKDGKINSGKELFGDQNGASNGFAELAKHDSNHDGKISSDDEAYNDLKLWADMDADGNVDDGEMKLLSELGIKSINTNFSGKAGEKTDEFGNDISMSGTFSREINGNLVSSKVTDVLFVNKDAEAQNLDDLSAILMKKMGAYSEVMGFHNSVIELSDVEDKETIRVGSQEASKETQRIGLNNELDAIDQEISLLNSQLNGLISNTEPSFIDSDNSSTINLAQGNGESSTLNNNQNKNSGENKSSNTQSSNQTQSNKTDNSISINSIRNSVNDLENQRTSVLARMTRLS